MNIYISEIKRIAKCLSRGANEGKLLLKGVALLVLVPMLLSGCLKNDIPYPRIQPNFTAIEADYLLKPAEIDSVSRLVTMTFDEEADLESVQITRYELSEGAKLEAGDLTAPINLSKYYIVTLSLYQNYDWVIRGVQNIERYFTVENQVGASIIDVTGRRVVVSLPSNVGLKKVRVQTMKLGPKGCITAPSLEGGLIDLTLPVEVKVFTHGKEEVWTIYGETVESTVETVRVDAWTQVAWVYGAAIEGRDNGVKYKKQGDATWTKAPAAWLTHTGATFYARLCNLDAQTAYVARAYSDDEYGVEVPFTTGGFGLVQNLSFEDWHKNGKVWNPWAEGADQYWDTGNKGATTLGDSNTVPTDDTASGIGKAAKLETRFVGIGAVGKLAAGNIFVGKYVRTDGTNGVLSFGRDFSERPTKVRGKLKYNCATISHSSTEFAHLKGQPDTCIVWCALIDSKEPFEIRTNPSNRNLFDPNGAEVVAYGKFESGKSIEQYTQFEFNLDYVATNRVPRYILLVGSASKYGDYFTGGNGSVLYLDELELVYDY